ncbi:Cytochrome oxidase biogenesis protein Cox11-CtaG, copper delivery to Cox1 [hydrothermal vent metagenome]|uniref:Cytochrome oxidase biogenesis protein Cox11-CtaG, copper delivery to Cox1 n=1 Tax=hydrothermal vent metagenome TaxID=652676 RepID=A0A3B0ZS76_9ZZZZ
MEAGSNSQATNKKTAWKLLIVVIAMFGFGYALVPLYDVVCQVLGIGRFADIESGKYDPKAQQQAIKEMTASKDLKRNITVEFVTVLNGGMKWEFKALQNEVIVHPGVMNTVDFYAKNLTGRDVIAQAVPRILPGSATKYFTKIECFCFTQQIFKKGEARTMPLKFMVSPDLPKRINTITLSYTFFDTQPVALK